MLSRSVFYCKYFLRQGTIFDGIIFSLDDVALCLSESIDDASLDTMMKLGLDTLFPREYAAWEGHRKQISQHFHGILTERQAETQAKLDQDLGNIRIKLWEAVTVEVLKPFP